MMKKEIFNVNEKKVNYQVLIFDKDFELIIMIIEIVFEINEEKFFFKYKEEKEKIQ